MAGPLDRQRRHESPTLGRGLGNARLCRRSQHDGPVSVAAFSPDGRTVITRRMGSGGPALGREDRPVDHSPIAARWHPACLAISPDGRTILTGSYDRTAQLWDKVTGKPIGPAFHHENQVWFVAISPDGRSVLSGGQENTAHLWNISASVDAPIKEVDRWVQVSTGMELLDDGSLHILDFTEWNDRREQVGLVRERNDVSINPANRE